MSLLLSLNFPIPYISVSFVDFEQVTTVLVNKIFAILRCCILVQDAFWSRRY